MKFRSIAAQSLLFHAGSHGFQMQSLPSTRAASTRLEAATALPVDNSVAVPREAEETKVGVLLLNLGGPETGDDVEGTYLASKLYFEELYHISNPVSLQNSCTIFLRIRISSDYLAPWRFCRGQLPISSRNDELRRAVLPTKVSGVGRQS